MSITFKPEIFEVINPDDKMLAAIVALEELLSDIQVQDCIQITCTNFWSAEIISHVLEETIEIHHGPIRPSAVDGQEPNEA